MGINRMKPSLIYCKQFQASRPLKVIPKDEPVVAVIVSAASGEPGVSEAKPEAAREQKKRGRKPNPKKEVPQFVIEEKETILVFS
jgi:hypothetical protein